MHVKFLTISATVFLSIFTTSLRSEEEISENHLLYQIIENESYCVEQYIEEKIVLKPESIIFSRDGLWLNLNGYNSVLLPQVMVNHLGFYIERSFGAVAKKEKIQGDCPGCGEVTNERGICKTDWCLFRGRKVL